MHILPVFSDCHVNSAVALCPDGPILRDDGQEITPSKSQQFINAAWMAYWEEVEAIKRGTPARVTSICTGDLVDINTHSGFQLIEPNNHDTVMDMGVEVLWPMRAVSDEWIIERGTEAHVGGSGWLENRIAKEVGAKIDPSTGLRSWWFAELSVEGVNITATHHPGTNSMRPWTLGGAANRAAAMMQDAYYLSGWKPNLSLFGHVHHNEDSYDNHAVRAIFNRSWAMKNAYDHRNGRGA